MPLSGNSYTASSRIVEGLDFSLHINSTTTINIVSPMVASTTGTVMASVLMEFCEPERKLWSDEMQQHKVGAGIE